MMLTACSPTSSPTSTNARVPPQHAETAYRVLDPQMCLDTTLCLKYRRRVGRDNTVKYRWRTLQLLPGTDRPSYAGAVVDVLEGLDGQLAVQHEGQIIPTQKAPQRPNILRNSTERTVPAPTPHIDSNGLGRRWADKLAQLDGEMESGTESEAQGAVHSWDRPGTGIHRDTVKKYMNAESPPLSRARAKSTVS